jgi:hypothetical protein
MASDSTLFTNLAGQRARAENRCQRLRRAAEDVSRTWHDWMESEDDAGMDAHVDAIQKLRTVLGSQDSHP